MLTTQAENIFMEPFSWWAQYLFHFSLKRQLLALADACAGYRLPPPPTVDLEFKLLRSVIRF